VGVVQGVVQCVLQWWCSANFFSRCVLHWACCKVYCSGCVSAVLLRECDLFSGVCFSVCCSGRVAVGVLQRCCRKTFTYIYMCMEGGRGESVPERKRARAREVCCRCVAECVAVGVAVVLQCDFFVVLQ